MVQLLVSRLIHDLSGPAGALSNGVEMAVEAEVLEPAISDLMTFSAEVLLGRIRFLGTAFGRVDMSDAVSLAPVVEAARRYLKDRPRLTLDFPIVVAPPGFPALLSMLVMLAAGCLPKSGEICVIPGTEEGEAGSAWRVTASGPTMRLDADLMKLLSGDDAPLTSYTVVASLAAKLAATLGWTLSTKTSVSDGMDRLDVVIGKSGLMNTET